MYLAQSNFMSNLIVEKNSPNFWATSVIFKMQSKVNDRPVGENSLNLVTLLLCKFYLKALCT
jgi:hypothetical protein